ncbi:aldehyde reductase [Nannochloropsis gaditana]|uniref:Aldehyde reductase n=1 Tax=Nannochloropsis gaditana TaxID=72520 RepID=W7TH63_9STRA|nr:aldehyde reductase [Nannochloropsis gaditana]
MDRGEGVGVLNNPVVQAIAREHSRTPAQVCLRWAVQRGYTAIPKSTHESRLQENLHVFDFTLSAEDMVKISGLNRHLRYNDPGEFCKGMGLPNGYPIYA